jgi:hypothetical protein
LNQFIEPFNNGSMNSMGVVVTANREIKLDIDVENNRKEGLYTNWKKSHYSTKPRRGDNNSVGSLDADQSLRHEKTHICIEFKLVDGWGIDN